MSTTAGDVLGDAYVNVLADTSQLGAGLAKAQDIVMGSLKKIAFQAASLIGVGLSIRGVFSGIKSAIDKGANLYDLSKQTNMAVKDIVILQQAFENAGASAGMLPRTIMKMQQMLGGKKGATLMQQIGLDRDQIMKMGAAEQFEAIGKALGSIKDPAQRTADAIKIFGRGGYMLKGLFSDPDAMRQARQGLGMMPEIMAKSAQGFDRLNDAISMSKNKMHGFWAGFLVGMEPVIKALTGFLERIDFAKMGLKVGNFIRALQLAFQEGKFGEIVFLSLQIGFIRALNFMIKGIQFAATAMTTILRTVFDQIIKPDFWIGVGQLALGGFMAIGAGLIEIFTTPITYMQAAMDVLMANLFNALGPKLGSTLLKTFFPFMKFLDVVTGGKYRTEADNLMKGVLTKERTEDTLTFKQALEARKKDGTWTTDQGKASASLSGEFINKGIENIANASKSDVITAAKKIMENFSEILTSPEMFSTEDLRARLASVMDPFMRRAEEEYAAKVGATGEMTPTNIPPERGGGFIGFKDAIKKVQEDQFKTAENQREQMIGLLGNIATNTKPGEVSIFGGNQ